MTYSACLGLREGSCVDAQRRRRRRRRINDQALIRELAVLEVKKENDYLNKRLESCNPRRRRDEKVEVTS